jgi:hypothetical protein
MGSQAEDIRCERCGSSKVIPRVPLWDHVGYASSAVVEQHVWVAGSPQAWLMKDWAIGSLQARICGECGHVELVVENYQELYAKYLKSLGDEG